jgi:hypothetical protein
MRVSVPAADAGEASAGNLRRRRVLYLTIEKRINFTIEALKPTAPAYDHFCKEMVHSPLFEAVRIALDFPQAFAGYARTKQLELWQFRAT